MLVTLGDQRVKTILHTEFSHHYRQLRSSLISFLTSKGEQRGPWKRSCIHMHAACLFADSISKGEVSIATGVLIPLYV